MQDAGLERVHFHTLRHAQASLLVRKGLHIQATGTRLGQSTATTTLNLYAHTMQETDHTAARILDRALGAPGKARKRPRSIPPVQNGANSGCQVCEAAGELTSLGHETPAN